MKTNTKIILLFLIIGAMTTSWSQAYLPGVSTITKQYAKEEVERVVPYTDNDTDFEKWYKRNFTITEIKLYGAGSILGLVSATEEIDENAAPTGSLGLNLSTASINLDLFYSYNAKQEVEINSLAQFGNTLINPNLGGKSLNLNLYAQLHTRAGISSNLKIADNIYKVDNVTVEASPLQFKFGGYFRPFEFSNVENNDVNILLDFHFTHRSLIGDVRNEIVLIEEKNVFNDTYNGFEFSLSTIVNKVRLYTQFSFNGKQELNIPGFSGTQVLFGLEVAGDFIVLKKKQ